MQGPQRERRTVHCYPNSSVYRLFTWRKVVTKWRAWILDMHGIWTTLVHHKKHSPNWTEQAISKVIRSKWRVSWLHVEAKKDTQISCSSWVLSKCKTKRKYEYWFWKLFVIQMSFLASKGGFKIIDSKFFGLRGKMPRFNQIFNWRKFIREQQTEL